MRYSHFQLTLNASTSSYILYGEKFLWDKLLVVSWTYFKLQNFNREKLTTMKAIPFTCNRYGEVLHAFVQWQCYSMVFLVAWRRYILILLAPVLHRFSQCGGEEHVGRVGVSSCCPMSRQDFTILRYKCGLHVPSLQCKPCLPSCCTETTIHVWYGCGLAFIFANGQSVKTLAHENVSPYSTDELLQLMHTCAYDQRRTMPMMPQLQEAEAA